MAAPADEMRCGGWDDVGKRELRAAARSDSGPILEGFLCKIATLSTL